MLTDNPFRSIAELLEQSNTLAIKVRTLKEQQADPANIQKAVEELKIAKEKHAAAAEAANAGKRAEEEKWRKTRVGVEKAAKSNFIYAQSASIYGGVGGLFDYGPLGVRMKNNLLEEWRYHFVHEEDMLEIESACLTPHKVLKTSGHVDKFDDYIVKDVETDKSSRADHLLEAKMEELLNDNTISEEQKAEYKKVHAEADSYSLKEIGEMLKKYNVKDPDTGNDLTDPQPFNLMFGTPIGPSGRLHGYLRPETAQGIFTNFRKLLECNNQKMPFAAAQIGLAFRNEIAPRAGLLRVREFQMAEIEHFCTDEKDEKHPKFESVFDLKMNLLPRKNQDGQNRIERITIGEAVSQGMVSKETLGYYMARTQLFLIRMGIHEPKLRFRQHMANEMAHYAQDCWDAEIRTSYGWIECVGLADRACYDLEKHMKESKVNLVAEVKYDEPKNIERVKVLFNNGLLGKTFRKSSKVVRETINEMDKEDLQNLVKQLESEDVDLATCEGTFKITKAMIKKLKITTEISHGHKYTPPVVEPSFGVGRILYSLLEHAFWTREDDANRIVLSLSPHIAPTTVAVLPLSSHADLKPSAKQIYTRLIRNRVSVKMDDSGVAIGRKYSRQDEKGTSFCCTIDFQTLDENTVTIRERDSMQQIRVAMSEVVDTIKGLSLEEMSWEDATKRYGLFTEASIKH